MSAPPIAITMWTPKASDTAVMTKSAKKATRPDCEPTKTQPNTITAIRPARLIQWRAGSSSGLPPILPESLPKATIEPEKVTAPIRMPT